MANISVLKSQSRVTRIKTKVVSERAKIIHKVRCPMGAFQSNKIDRLTISAVLTCAMIYMCKILSNENEKVWRKRGSFSETVFNWQLRAGGVVTMFTCSDGFGLRSLNECSCVCMGRVVSVRQSTSSNL